MGLTHDGYLPKKNLSSKQGRHDRSIKCADVRGRHQGSAALAVRSRQSPGYANFASPSIHGFVGCLFEQRSGSF